MAVTFGKLEEFDTATGEDCIQYVERMEYYFQANGITEEGTKRAVLISAMGGKGYKLMRNLISPVKPKDKSFEQLVEIMKKHFCPPPSEIVHRYKFIIIIIINYLAAVTYNQVQPLRINYLASQFKPYT